MNSFITRKIGTLGRVVTGKTPSTANEDFFDGPYPFITIPDLDGRVIIDSSARTLSQAGADAIKSSLLPAGSVMMSCIATVGKCGITGRKSFTNQQINSVVPNDDVDPQFLYYLFREIGQELELSGGGGSVYTNVSKSRFSDIEVSVPPLPEQRAIAATLGALDDKIELNRKMNATLESMARALFRDWFVDFGPTRAKATGAEPYLAPEIWSLFPDRLDDEGKPEGWEVRPILSVAPLQPGKTWPKDIRDELGLALAFGANGPIGNSSQWMDDDEVLFLGKIGSCGAINEYKGRFWATNNTYYLTPKYCSHFHFARQVVKRVDWSAFVGGSSNPYMPTKNFDHIEVIVGPVGSMAAFEEVATTLMDRVHASNAEIETLAQTRDLLLPRLMSGELRVAEVEAATAEPEAAPC